MQTMVKRDYIDLSLYQHKALYHVLFVCLFVYLIKDRVGPGKG